MSRATDIRSEAGRRPAVQVAGDSVEPGFSHVVTAIRPPLNPPRVTLRGVAMGSAALVGAIAVGVLVGWALGIPELTSWQTGFVAMKVNAALCLLGLAMALALVASAPRKSHPAAWLLCGLVIAIAGATLAEHVTGLNLGIDEFFVSDQASAASPHPGRFAVQTAFAFLTAALAILSIGRSVRGFHLSELLVMGCAVVGGISVLGYLYGAQELLSLGSATQVSLPASVGLAVLPFGILAADPEHSLARQMTDPGPAGQVMRRIVPAALVVVPIGAWVRLIGERAGLYDETVGLSLLVTLEAFVLMAIGAWTTASVKRLVLQRQQAELDLVRLGAAVSTPLIETAPIGLAILDRSLRYLYVNPALAAFDGMDAMAHLGQRLNRVSPALGLDAAAALEGVLETGQPIRNVEVSGMASAGQDPGTWLLSAEPLNDESGDAVGLAMSVVDITERKRREQALAELSELRQQAQVISDSIPFGFWTADPEGRIEYLSPSFLHLIGRSANEALGLAWVQALEPETAQATLTDWHSAVATRRPWSFEYTVRGVDDRLHTILSRGFPIWEVDGRLRSWAGLNLDLTDRKDAEAFREAFAGILSHELRTPITSIHAATKLLGRTGLAEEQRAELLDDISQEAERLRRLVEDLVVLAKVERGTIQIRTEPVLLPHILRKMCAQEEVRWPDRHISFTTVGHLPVVRAEAAFVEQIVRNLIGNAAKYGPPDGHIDVIADVADGMPRVRVLDRGPGVDPKEAKRLFELFYRSERTTATTGSGIGLFLAHRLIESMDGTIWARPRDDGPGAEFGFTLQPMAEDA